MNPHAETGVRGRVENPRERWAIETKAAIEFEEDPHQAALNDNPEFVYVSKRTWAAIFALSLSLGAPIGLIFLGLASVANEVCRDLNARGLEPWVVGTWSIGSACSAAVAGYLSDVFGRRNVIVTGDLLVLLGSILGGTARSIELLIVAQTLVGLGTGFCFDAFAAVPEMLPNKWRAMGAGIVEGGINVPWATISVILANLVARYASWRWIYYISILLSFITFKATLLLYWPVSRPQGDFHKTRWQQIKELDYVGIFTITGGIVLFTCGLTWGGMTFPWNHPGSILPIIIGVLAIVGGFVYDWKIPQRPMVPMNLFWPAMFRKYLAILIVLFVSGANFYALSGLLPMGSALLFTPDGLEIGIMSLPNTIMQLVAGFMFPLIAHKVPRVVPWLTIKWQLVCGMALQAFFLGLSAISMAPNQPASRGAYVFLPAFGVPMFTWVTILSYAIASLHVPHSQLGTALGLLGTFRSTGGAVGNAAFGALFQGRSASAVAAKVQAACSMLANCPSDNATAFPDILAQTMAFNLGVPGSLAEFPASSREVLQAALRSGYGEAFRAVFLATIPFSVIAMLCAIWIEDPWPYMNNHVQFRMYEHGGFRLRSPEEPALTGATVLHIGAMHKKMSPDGEQEQYGTELGRVESQASVARLVERGA